MTSRFQGDPYLVMTDDGVDMPFIGGQPVMDQGFENQVNISLLTKEGWAGNALLVNDNEKIGSDFIEVANGPITLSTLSDLEKSAKKALASEAFGDVESFTSNPTSQRLDIINTITPLGSDSQIFTATRNGQNWLAQAFNPAHLK
jgi:hypothetical protein